MISTLPDDILLHILSFLTMKEAGRTSVLSKRWRHVWAYIPNLNFVTSIEFNTYKKRVKVRREEIKYLHWVDQVVSTHKAPSIDEFRVGFDIRVIHSNPSLISKWVAFAMEKRVKMLEVDLTLNYVNYRGFRHTFPSLSVSNRLTSLELGCVNITGEAVESLLCNCPALECLSVKYSDSLVELIVNGPSLKLKFLRIYRCYELKKFEIDAPNLVTLHYTGRQINVQLKCTPKLSEVSIGFAYARDLNNSFSDLSSYISQIEVLCLTPDCDFKEIRMYDKDPVFTRLRKLELEVTPEWSDELCCLASLIFQLLSYRSPFSSNNFGHYRSPFSNW